jgi:hypothetical protein
MPKKRYNAEEIIHKLRSADVLLSQGKTVGHACKQLGVSDQTYYRWRKIYGGMCTSSKGFGLETGFAKRRFWFQPRPLFRLDTPSFFFSLYAA